MKIKDERQKNQPYISQQIHDKLKKKNIKLIYEQKYDWYRVYIVRPFCYGYLYWYSFIGYIHSCDYSSLSLYPYYFHVENHHDEFIGLIEDISEFEKILVRLKDRSC